MASGSDRRDNIPEAVTMGVCCVGKVVVSGIAIVVMITCRCMIYDLAPGDSLTTTGNDIIYKMLFRVMQMHSVGWPTAAVTVHKNGQNRCQSIWIDGIREDSQLFNS